MILIVTYKEDYTADFLINKLNEQGKKFLRLNTEDIEKYTYESKNETDFFFQINNIETFDGVWFRRLKLPELNAEPSIAAYLASEYEFLFSNILRNIDSKRWMSQPDALHRAENKTVQLKLAQSIGFNIPNTLVTNNKILVKEFAEKHKQSGIVIKPLFSGRIESASDLQLIYTSELDQNHLDLIENFDLTPCIFQEKIPKEYELRVTVVGKDVFAARVNSQENEKTKVDWRRERLAFTPYSLSSDLADKCVNLIHALNTSFGAIDLIKSTDDKYYFLENNPNGQWAWIEMDTGILISQAIINFLNGT